MSRVSVNNLTFCYEGSFDNIFENASFSIDTNWKLGFVGRNGKGKTTFLKLLNGEYKYKGCIESSVTFDYFPYKISGENKKRCIMEFAKELKNDCEDWKIICELDKLKADVQILYRPFETLSFGEQTKVMLAILFSGENEFLLIDEPTNHLDKDTREVVKKYLALKKGFILVSHDRELLDACVDHVLVLNRKTIEVQSGDFSSWWENKQKKDAFAIDENEKHKKEIKKLKKVAAQTKEWADKNEQTKIGFDPIKEHDRNISTRAYIGAKTKKMQSRVKHMQSRIDREIDEKEGLLNDIEKIVNLKIEPLEYHKERLLLARNYGLKYKDASQDLFNNLNFEIRQGERVFLNGENGCGKSSLIKAVLAKLDNKDLNCEEKGELQVASGIIISYINQDTSFIRGSITQYCKDKKLEENLFCTLLFQLGMDRVQFGKDMKDFSEGQKKKVLIAASLLKRAHLYIWDEPLNYIDVFTRIQIEKLCKEFNPTMLIVEHDEKFREQIATKIINM